MIVATAVTITQDGNRRICAYRCQDSQGVWHDYGPVITVDPAFDAEAHKALVADKVATVLARSEFDELTR